MRNLRREARWLPVIGAIVAIALACTAYMLSHQRLASPFDERYSVRVELASANAVEPGLGAAVNVAGVKVGQIAGRDLVDGRAVLELRIDPSQLPRLHEGTRAALVPNTPLNDMQVDLAPGDPQGRPIPDGATIPLAATLTPSSSDELLMAFDTDTREYLRLLIADLGAGTQDRGPDLRGLLRSLGPTTGQVREISALLTSRRRELPRLVHNLSLLMRTAGSEDRAVRRIVSAGNATLAAVASQDGALRESLMLLPGTLRRARGTLVNAAPFARSLRRTLVALEPAVPRLERTLRTAPDAVRGLLPVPIPELKRFTRAVAPLGRQVRPAAADLGEALPSLEAAFDVIGRTTNIMGNAPDAPDRSYLFWIAWFAHNASSMLSTQDAHGAVWRGMALFSCSGFSQPGPMAAAFEAVAGTPSACLDGGGG